MASVVLRSVLCNAVFSRTTNQGSIRFSQEAWVGVPRNSTLSGMGRHKIQGSVMCAEVIPNQIDLAHEHAVSSPAKACR